MNLHINSVVDVVDGTAGVGQTGSIIKIIYNTPYAPLENIYQVELNSNNPGFAGLILFLLENEISINKEWYREQQLNKLLK